MTSPVRPPRIAIYARYSSDLQNPCSVDDQVALLRRLITEHGHGDPGKALVFSDAAISGATMERPGLARLLATAKAGRIDLVVAEGLDRLSRSLKDIAALHETLSYHGAEIWTAHEGRVTELHIGLKGTMNALQLRDMKARVKRGHKARIEAGYAVSSCAYGYKPVRGVVDAKGRNVNGLREIVEEEAAVIRRVCEEYAAGIGIPDIVARLNRDGIPAPNGGLWKRNAVMGGVRKQEGILRNEVYLGRLVFNKHHVVRDPVTNRKRYIPNPEAEWTRVEALHLRIVGDDLWARVRARDNTTPRQPGRPRRPRKKPEGEAPLLTRHNQHGLTGWVKCGWCGEAKQLANDSRYLCSANRYAKACKNARGTREGVLMEAVIEALCARVHDGPPLRPALVQALKGEGRRYRTLDKRRKTIEVRIGRLVEAIERGVDRDHVTARLLALQTELIHVRADLEGTFPAVVPSEAEIRATFMAGIAAVIQADDVRKSRLMFRCVLDSVVLTPIPDTKRGETWDITLREEGWPDFWRLLHTP